MAEAWLKTKDQCYDRLRTCIGLVASLLDTDHPDRVPLAVSCLRTALADCERYEADLRMVPRYGHECIAAVIAAIGDPRALLRKKWHDAWPTTTSGTTFI